MPPAARTRAFHLGAALFFGACVPLLLEEAYHLPPWFARIERVLVVGAAALAALGVRFLVASLLARPTSVLRSRSSVFAYLFVMLAAGALATIAMRALGQPHRPALAAFLVGAAIWLLVVGMDLLPSWFAGEKLLVDRLGRTLSRERLTWAELRPQSNGRAALLAGDEGGLRMRVVGLRQDLERLHAQIQACTSVRD